MAFTLKNLATHPQRSAARESKRLKVHRMCAEAHRAKVLTEIQASPRRFSVSDIYQRLMTAGQNMSMSTLQRSSLELRILAF